MSDQAHCPDCKSDHLKPINLDSLGMGVLAKKLEAFQCQRCGAIVFHMLDEDDIGNEEPDPHAQQNPRSL